MEATDNKAATAVEAAAAVLAALAQTPQAEGTVEPASSPALPGQPFGTPAAVALVLGTPKAVPLGLELAALGRHQQTALRFPFRTQGPAAGEYLTVTIRQQRAQMVLS